MEGIDSPVEESRSARQSECARCGTWPSGTVTLALRPSDWDGVGYTLTAYPAACATRLKNSRAVTDRFHVAKKFNETVDALRKK